MYLAVDTGGTKTLVAAVDEMGIIKQQLRFPTPKSYNEFTDELAKNVDQLTTKEFEAACIAIPGRLDRKAGKVISLGNLPWKNEPVLADCEKIFKCPTIIENDANLAGLSEAMLHKDCDSVLYITVSTGIGTGAVYKQELSPALLDMEGGHMIMPHDGKLEKWERFASGKAFYEYFGKLGADIPASDEQTWGIFARGLAVGFFDLITIVQPDLIVIGGSMGEHFEKYISLLKAELNKYSVSVIKMPKIVQAERPDEAVIFGCYDLARQTYGHSA